MAANKAVQLLLDWDAFEQKHPGGQIEDFCRYYLNKKPAAKTSANSRGLLLRTIGRISSAFNVYHRAAMRKTNLPMPEGFYYLNGLATKGELRKTALINFLMVEYATGMEAISKLLKAGMIRERPDESDGRASILSLTEKGKKTLSQCYAYTSKAADILLGRLDEEATQTCIRLLKETEERHSVQAVEWKSLDFDEMLERSLKV